jgi:hypothetical protein
MSKSTLSPKPPCRDQRVCALQVPVLAQSLRLAVCSPRQRCGPHLPQQARHRPIPSQRLGSRHRATSCPLREKIACAQRWWASFASRPRTGRCLKPAWLYRVRRNRSKVDPRDPWGKTEGDGRVNDFTRECVLSALCAVLAPYVDLPPHRVEERIASGMSGGPEGLLSPHITVFTRGYVVGRQFSSAS